MDAVALINNTGDYLNVHKHITGKQVTELQKMIYKTMACFDCRAQPGECNIILMPIVFDDGQEEIICSACMQHCSKCNVYFSTDAIESTGDHTYCTVNEDDIGEEEETLDDEEIEAEAKLRQIKDKKRKLEVAKKSIKQKH